MKLRPYQQRGVEAALALQPGQKLLASAPTGTGKGVIQQAVKTAFPSSVILSPSLEILRSYADRWGIPVSKCEDNGLYTPTAYRNRLMAGLEPPEMIIYDEAHHINEITSTVTADIMAIAPLARHFGMTATPYRGTPRGTQQLIEMWGPPLILLNIAQAVADQYWQMPQLHIEPLLDDDQLVIVNGEFQIQSVNDGTANRIDSLVACIRKWRNGPTMVCLPSTVMVDICEAKMTGEVVRITQDTSEADRKAAYDACQAGTHVLLQIKAVSEGVDLPWLQTVVDARPLLSPVAWLQTFGRLTRPFPAVKHYVCTNRNLERHAYLLDGMAPMSKIAEAQAAFGGMSERAAGKTIGLEACARFKPIPVPLHGGCNAATYMLQTVGEDRRLREYLILCLPNHPEPVTFSRTNGAAQWVEGMPQREWGKWKIERRLPEDLVGYRSSPQTGSLSDKQKEFWQKYAEGRGLDKAAAGELKRRQFPLLPALLDTRLTLRGLLK